MAEGDDKFPFRGLYRFILLAVFALGCIWEGGKGIYRELPKALSKPLSPDPVAALHDVTVQALVLGLGVALIVVFVVLVRRDSRDETESDRGRVRREGKKV